MVNAFCYADGSILITTGLLQQIRPTYDELAALLAHEMGHVQSRHMQRRNQKFGVAKFFADVLCFVLENMFMDDTGGMDKNMVTLSQKLVVWLVGLGEKGFSRRDEYQADAVAWELQRSESNPYNPKALYNLLAKLHDFEEATGMANIARSWSSTHPATEARMETIQKKWDRLSSRERMHYEFYSL